MPESEHLLQDTKVGVSQARLAAESAFAAVPTPSPTDGVPVVIRRRKIVIGDEGSTDPHQSADDDASARAPKVFQVEPRHDAEFKAAVDRDAAATLASCDVSQTRDVRRNRRRRRQARRSGSVTVIRPEPPSSTELAQRRREAEERYELLMTEVRALDSQIEAARRAEAAKAVRWIRKAIADYDLRAEDLGF
jgi:hypothetical protein